MSVIGTTNTWSKDTPISIGGKDRRQHVYVIGQTGTGKTTLLNNLLIQDIENGAGVGLIDPHGDLAEELLNHIPPWRTDDVAYFNPADLDYPIGLNPLQTVSPDEHHLVVDGIIASLKSIWGDVWGHGRMQYVTNHTLSALLYYDHGTFLGVNRLLADPLFRRKVLSRVNNPIVKAFWHQEFEALKKSEQAAVVAPIQNKVGQFTVATPMRNILGQTRSRIDLRRTMDERRIFIANLSKGLIGAENSRLLGSFLVAQFQLAAMQRAGIPEEDRQDFHLYIDEFQNFTTDSFESILSEARKYRLCLTLAHQYIDQLNPSLRSAVFGNVGTLIAFRVGNQDAAVLETPFHPLETQALFELPKHTAWVKLLQEGEVSDPLQVHTLPPLDTFYGRRDFLIQHSRERFGRPRSVVEAKINQWMGF